ncbi:MAG: hypothetical protein ACFCVB_06310 [Nodosilinea sp.]
MKPNSLYAQLELIPEPPEQPVQTGYSLGRAWAAVKARVGPAGMALFAYFCGSTAPRVRLECDRNGNTLFVVYDPVSRERHTFSSEQALRVWADQRYYQ